MPRRRRPRGPSLFEELVFAPDRDRVPGTRPVVSTSERDDPELLRELSAHTHARHELSRRGAWHGAWTELDLTALGLGPRHAAPDAAALKQRWRAARPVVLPGQLPAGGEGSLVEAFQLFEELPSPGALAAWVRAREELLPDGWALHPRRARLTDPARDIEKVHLAAPGPPGHQRRELWVKTGWLSDHPDDRSLRLRVSFGREVHDDASRDERSHRQVGGAATALIPRALSVAEDAALHLALETACGAEVYLTQHIAYWNCPDGGASFHHDAFDPCAAGGQLGVCYVQLAGRTAWLALSITDLAERVREFVEHLAEGATPWLRDQLFPRGADFERLQERVADDAALLRELALPGLGALGPLVNRGPEFSAFLADGGHALVLEPGDVLLLPNHGLAHTAMHSVFCASQEPTYALSMAVRALRPPPAPEPPEPWAEEEPGDGA